MIYCGFINSGMCALNLSYKYVATCWLHANEILDLRYSRLFSVT